MTLISQAELPEKKAKILASNQKQCQVDDFMSMFSRCSNSPNDTSCQMIKVNFIGTVKLTRETGREPSL